MMIWVRFRDPVSYQEDMLRIPSGWDSFTFRGWMFRRSLEDPEAFWHSSEVITADRIPSMLTSQP